MKDRIDEINERKRISSSIIKSWNVNYVPVINKPTNSESDDILARLEQSAAEKKRQEIEAVYQQVEEKEKEDRIRQDQIHQILHGKPDVVREVMEQMKDTDI